MKISRMTAALMCVVLLFAFAPALAEQDVDAQRDVTLGIFFKGEDGGLVDAQIDIFQIAELNVSGELVLTDEFEAYGISLEDQSDADWRTLGSTLEGYVLRDKIAPTDSGKTDRNGFLRFPNQSGKLKQGLYLMLSARHEQGGYAYDPKPIIVQLPARSADQTEWVYDVIVNAKFDSRPQTGDSVTRKVLKVWDDKGYEHKRPEEIEVQLLRNGEVYDTVTLNARNSWRYTWNDLDGQYRWLVVEKEPGDYTVSSVQEGITFVITNEYTKVEPTPTPTPEPDEPKLPQTGQAWWPVPMLISGGLLMIIIGLLVKRQGAAHEE